MPATVPLQPPRKLAPNFTVSTPKIYENESQRAGIYTRNQLRDFLVNILHSDASEAVLKENIQEKFCLGKQIDHTQKYDIFSSAMAINRQIYFRHESFLP